METAMFRSVVSGRPAALQLVPPPQSATDREHAAMHAEMDAAMVRLHADFDAIVAGIDDTYDRVGRDMARAVRRLERASRPSLWARVRSGLRRLLLVEAI